MPLDLSDLPVVRPLAWFFRHVLFEWLIEDFFFSLICIPIGWTLLRIVTAGRTPDASLRVCMRHEDDDGLLPGVVGVAVIVAIGVTVMFAGSD